MEYEIFQSKRITLKYDEIYREVFRPYFQLYCSVFNSFILRSLLFTLSEIFSYLYTFSKYFLLIDKKEYLPYEGFFLLFFIFFLERDIQIRLIIFVRHSKI